MLRLDRHINDNLGLIKLMVQPSAVARSALLVYDLDIVS